VTMKKLAIFVEGRTECVFVETLIGKLISEAKVQFAVFQTAGGSGKTPRRIRVLRQTPPNPAQEFYVQIMESHNDERVGSDIRDRYDELVGRDFVGIIGIRDAYPEVTLAEIPKLRIGFKYRMKTKPVDPLLVLGVMEVEAWFLAEHTHFSRIHKGLTADRICATFGFDPRTDDMQGRACPHDDLNKIYKLEKRAYRKNKKQRSRTIDALDFESIYLGNRSQFPKPYSPIWPFRVG
jgi:hypothetical protein